MFNFFTKASSTDSELKTELEAARNDVALLQDLLRNMDDSVESMTEAFGLLRAQHKHAISQATLTIAALLTMLGGETKLTKELLDSVGAISNLGVNISAADADGAKTVKLIDMVVAAEQEMAAAAETIENGDVDFDEEATDCDCPKCCSHTC